MYTTKDDETIVARARAKSQECVQWVLQLERSQEMRGASGGAGKDCEELRG